MSDVKISIQNLYKIFGKNPRTAMEHVNNGVGKQELLNKYGHVLGLQNINLDLHERSIEVIMGLSGSGKSTLIRHINRLLDPTTGSVVIDGEDILKMSAAGLRELRQNKVSMVFQKFALMPHHTILQNVEFGLDLRADVAASEKRERAEYWLQRVGLKGVEAQYPGHLSGGMQQRVGLARALATDADILLMDEAFSALDPLIRTDMQDMLLELQAELNKTIIFITHDLDEALRIGDRIAILNDGALVQQGSAQQILLHPQDDYVRRFVADVNRVKVLRVNAIMTPVTDLTEEVDDSRPMTVKSGQRVEHLMNKVVLTNPSSIWVLDSDGQRTGYISRAALAETIGRDEDASWNSAA
ncbi:MAG: betaine/proline/choline family ABC transporter ATP-binding protein [Gammaproteobacteria bacterium]|nr:betaine/proline/choline family ABC transporter ATP-binding protein [Gammaproteobacteria bacterium]